MASHDALVIGSGPNGLAAAISTEACRICSSCLPDPRASSTLHQCKDCISPPLLHRRTEACTVCAAISLQRHLCASCKKRNYEYDRTHQAASSKDAVSAATRLWRKESKATSSAWRLLKFFLTFLLRCTHEESSEPSR
jgi:hypothetical protein